MMYPDTKTAIFLARPNRFVAHVLVEGEAVAAHVRNTGRCKEILVPGAKVVVQKSRNPQRKTAWGLCAVWKGERLINIDSGAPNRVLYEHLQSGGLLDGLTLLKPETVYGQSRFDFYAEAGDRRMFIEVKGVTLEENNIALFPDAPTLRGVKHVNELIRCREEGYEARIIFVVQMQGIRYVAPNNKTHPAFGEALAAAHRAGVEITALDCIVTEDSLCIGNPVEMRVGG